MKHQLFLIAVGHQPHRKEQLRSDTATQRHKVFPMCWDLVKVLYL